MASLTQWSWVWAIPGRWWRTGKPGVLQSMGLQSQTQLSDWTTATKPADIWLSAGTSLRLAPASQRVEPETSWPQPWPHLGSLLEQYCLLSLFSCWGMSDSFVTPWTIAHQAPLSMGFLGQEYWSGLPFPSPGTLPHPEIKSVSLALTGRFFTTEPPGKPRTMLSLDQDSPLALSPLQHYFDLISKEWGLGIPMVIKITQVILM